MGAETFGTDGPAAIIVVRSWREPNGTYRYQMSFAPDGEPGHRVEAYAVSAEVALEQVRRWLAAQA